MAKHGDALCEGVMKSGIVQNTAGKTLSKEELLPLLSGMNTQPLAVVKSFLPGLKEEDWKSLLDDLNTQEEQGAI
jgi:hypothetical protein